MTLNQILLGLILFVLLGGFLQITGKFHFFYIEQLQLFQFSEDYLADKISSPGGLSLIIGEFLTQFFITPYAGPFIIAAILTSIGLTMREIILQIPALLTPGFILIIDSIRLQLFSTRHYRIPILFD